MARTGEESEKLLIVACPACRARFRFERALFRGAAGVRVRCRRCGESIEIRNPDVAPHPAPAVPSAEHPEVSGDVGCPSCGARFRFDPQLFRGAPGVRIRCRRCGGSIEIRNPGYSPGTGAAEPAPAGEGHAGDPGDPALLPTIVPDSDWKELSVEPAGDSGSPIAPPALAPVPDWKELSDIDGSAPGPPAPADAAGGAARPGIQETPPRPAAPSPGRAWGSRTEIHRIATRTAAEPRRPPRPGASLLPYLGAAVAFLLAVAGALWYLESPRAPGHAAAPSADAPRPPAPPEADTDEVFDRIETSYPPNPQAGTLFVLKGRVSGGSGDASGTRIRVRATIFDAKKGVVAQNSVLAGAMVPDAVLREKSRTEIERAISEAAAAPPAPTAADGSVPFMIVFFDVVGRFSSYELATETVQGPD